MEGNSIVVYFAWAGGVWLVASEASFFPFMTLYEHVYSAA